MAVLYGSPDGAAAHDGFLAFLMLAANDHLHDWLPDEKETLTPVEEVLGPIFFSSVFNRSNDPLRTLLRTIDIAGHRSPRQFADAGDWERIQLEAFGTTFEEYVEMFLAPMLILSRGWGLERPPVTMRAQWVGRDQRERALYERWFSEASLTLDRARAAFGSRTLPSGLPGLPGEYFRHPFIEIGNLLVCLSPWHVRDHAVFGTWAKLNAATKRILGTSSNQVFSSAFGDAFERWCGSLAEESMKQPKFRDRVILPSAPGAADEIEDVVMHDGSLVALFSAKASPVPEANLKTAARVEEVITWLRRFFFEERGVARAKRHRGGAAFLLDEKVKRLRAGAFEGRGLKRDAQVLPCILSFDNLGETPALYKWLDDECKRRGILSARAGVRPLTVITPEDYEALLALGVEGRGVCRLLAEKTQTRFAYLPLDKFLYDRSNGGRIKPLPWLSGRFDRIRDRAVERMRQSMEIIMASQQVALANA